MRLLGEYSVHALEAQVEFGDPGARDYPEWRTGHEAAISTRQVIAVATRGDEHGPVRIEVWEGPLHDRQIGAGVLETEIETTGPMAAVGNGLGGELHEVYVGPGPHQVQVFVEPATQPDVVRFVVRP